MLKGSSKAIKLYTIDIDFSYLNPIPDRYGKITSKKRREILSNEKMVLFNDLRSGKTKTDYVLEHDSEMKKLLSDRGAQSRAAFLKTYNEAFLNYIGGDWMKSKDLLEKCLLLKPGDGPSAVIKDYLESFNFDSKTYTVEGKISPWIGARSLLSKY
jgi:hypothetical protein